MTLGRTTRCWGVAVAIGLVLPAWRPLSADQGSNVPAPFPKPTPEAPPAPASQAKPAPSSFESLWTVPFAGDGPLTLTFTPSSLILAGSEIATEARALDDGRVLWTSKREADTAPVVAGDLLILPSDGQFVALNIADGRDVWAAESAGAVQPPVAAGDIVLLASGTTLTARRAADGAPLWAANLGANATAAPAAGDTRVVVALDDQTLAAFDRAQGQPLWREHVDVTPLALAVIGDRVFVSAAEGWACAHKIEHGRRDWCFPVRVRPIGAAVGDERQVYFAFLDNTVHVFNRRSGRRYFTPPLDALPAAGPTLTAEEVVVPVVTGEFVLLSVRDGFKASRVSTPRALELPSTRAAAVAADGSALAIVITSAGGRYSIVLFKRKAAPETPKAPEPTVIEPPLPDGSEPKSVDTAPDMPPAPTAP